MRRPLAVLTISEVPAGIVQAQLFRAVTFAQQSVSFPAQVKIVKALHSSWLAFQVVDPRLR